MAVFDKFYLILSLSCGVYFPLLLTLLVVPLCFEFSSVLSCGALESGSHPERVLATVTRRALFAAAFGQEFMALHTFADDSILWFSPILF
jgi:hypothetical protein